MTAEQPAPPRRRNAAQTRQSLLDVARFKFARDGYAATTVRDIADEAGVNVALISRYFASKEGLFEACLTSAVTDVRRESAGVGRGDLAAVLARRLSNSPGEDRQRNALLLLVRSSGDERIDQLRRTVLRSMSEKLAIAAGSAEPDEAALLRSQLLLAMSLGILFLRSKPGVQPLTSAGEDDLLGPLTDVIAGLFPGPGEPG